MPVDPAELSRLSARELLQQGTALLHANRVEDASIVIFTLCERFTAAEESVPPHVMSLFALCLARQGKRKEAIETGRSAVRRDSRSATCRLHMARIYLLADSRRKAFEEISAGLTHSPGHPELLKLQREMGVRRPPVIGFLSRDNPLNIKLGKARAAKKKG